MCLLFRDACVWLFDSLHGVWLVEQLKFSQPCYRGDHLSWSISSERLGSVCTDLCPRHFGYFHGLSLVKIRQIQTVTFATRSDGFAFAVTLLVGLVFSLQLAIFAGVITSILLFLRKVAHPQLVEYGYTEEGTQPRRRLIPNDQPEVFIVHVEELFLRQRFILRTD